LISNALNFPVVRGKWTCLPVLHVFHLLNLVAGLPQMPVSPGKQFCRLIFSFSGGLYLAESYENVQRAVNAIRVRQGTFAGRIELRDIPHREWPHRDMMAA
jgi:hypothetical protein